MNKPLFDIDRAGMQVTVNSYQPGNGFVWQSLFPLKYTPRFDIKGLEGNEGIPVAADRVSFNTKAPKKTRKTVGSWSGNLSKYAVSREKDEMAINEYNDLQTLAAANTEDTATAKYLVDMVYDDVTFCQKAMDAKVEIDACRIATSGKQTYTSAIDGDLATDDIIDFNIPTDNKMGVKTVWSNDETADGIADLVNAQRAIAKKGLNKPMFAIMEQSTFEALAAQTKTARRLYPHYDANSLSTVSTSITVADVNKYLIGHGFPELIVIDTYSTVEAKDGTQTTIKPWNENVVALAPTAQLGWTYYKPVPTVQNTDALQVQGSYYKMTRYSENNPMLEVTMAEGYVQPGLINRASLVLMNVTNTKWNDGE